MNEFLIVRLSNNQADKTQWLVWSESQQEVIASGELHGQGVLSELSTYAQQRRTLVLVAANSLVLNEAEIPAGASRQFESMLPYVVEDELAQDVDQLHFTILNKEAGKAHYCAIDKGWLESQLEQLREVGCHVQKVLPDVLALPDLESISAVELDGQWLLKKSPYTGMSVESDWLALVAQSDWVKQDDEFLPLTAYSALPKLSLAKEQEWHSDEPILVMELLAKGALSSKVNLLTGAFKPKSPINRHWKVWRKVAMAAVFLLAVVLVDNVLQIQRYEAQAQAYRAESERIFRKALPGKTKIPTVSYLKREMNREAQRLAGGGADSSMLEQMVKMPSLLKQVPTLKLTSFKYDNGREEVRLQAQSDDFQTFEKASQLFATQFKVQQGQLNRSGSVVNGSFVLTPQ